MQIRDTAPFGGARWFPATPGRTAPDPFEGSSSPHLAIPHHPE